MAKKQALSWVDDVLNFFNVVVEKIVEHSDSQIQEIKKRTLHYIIVYGLFTISILFLLLGLIKYLAEIGLFGSSEGIGFMIVGSMMIVILAAYSLIKRI